MSFLNFGYRIILAPKNKVEECSLLYFVKDFVKSGIVSSLPICYTFPVASSGLVSFLVRRFNCELNYFNRY